jgi:HSP20 family protein
MAMLTRLDPFRGFLRYQDGVARSFEDRLALRGGESVGWTPACESFEDGEAVTLRFELAGVEPKDVEIIYENGVVTLRCERKLEREEQRDGYQRVEMAYGSFTRSFSLPAVVDAEKTKAAARNGVLTVTLPKEADS